MNGVDIVFFVVVALVIGHVHGYISACAALDKERKELENKAIYVAKHNHSAAIYWRERAFRQEREQRIDGDEWKDADR
jgi:hypothetical protein